MIKFKLNALYDSELGQECLNDFLNDDCVSNYNEHYIIIFENEDFKNKSYFKKSYLNKLRKCDLWQRLSELNLIDDLIFENITKKELINILLNLTNEEYYKNHYDSVDCWRDLECDFIIYGYSQGEAVKFVLVGSENFINDFKENLNTESVLTNLFFKTPSVITLTILKCEEIRDFLSECEFKEIYFVDLTEYLEDSYNYDKEELINNFEKDYCGIYKNDILEYLKNNLDENLKYI